MGEIKNVIIKCNKCSYADIYSTDDLTIKVGTNWKIEDGCKNPDGCNSHSGIVTTI